MSRIKDILIVVLALVVAYLLISRGTFTSETGDSKSSRHTVAILPVTCMDQRPEASSVCEAIWDETTSQLIDLESMDVVIRSQASNRTRQENDPASVGKALGADYILEGTVRSNDTLTRVTAQLIRADDAMHVWSKSYDSDLPDVDSVPRELARSIGTVLLSDVR